MKFSKASIALLVIQLAIVSTVAAKYLYQRASCPRVWTRTAAYDPALIMRGRYLSLQLTVDGCGSTLPSAKDAEFPRSINGDPGRKDFLHPCGRYCLVPGKTRRERQQANCDSRSRIGYFHGNTDNRWKFRLILRPDASRAARQFLHPRTRRRSNPTQARPGALDRSDRPAEGPATPIAVGAKKQRRMEAARVSVGLKRAVVTVPATFLGRMESVGGIPTLLSDPSGDNLPHRAWVPFSRD